jgi:peptidyl-prolyl cis-trans isomerase C
MLVLLSLLACKPEVPPAPVPGVITDHGERVFTVNGVEVGERELSLVYSLMKIPEARRAEFAKAGEGRHVAEEYAAATVLYQMALDQKLHEDPQIALELAFTARQILGARMRSKLAKDSVTEEAIQKWYDANKAQFSKPEALVRQILVADKVLATDLLQRLQSGEDFAALAAAHSIDDTSKEKGGDLGWIRIDDPTIGETLKTAELNKVVGPVESRFGFHVMEVKQRRDTTPLDDVREAARVQLAADEAAKRIEEIRSSMKIEWVNPPTVEAKPLPTAPPSGPQGGMPPNHPAPGAGGMPSDHPSQGGGGGGMPSNHPGQGGASPHGGN